MDQTFQQLGQLLFDSIPTILIFIVLHFYLKRVLYKPLQAVLAARSARIEGKLEAAAQARAAAEQRLAHYEDALRAARTANYKHMEARRQAARSVAQQQLHDARHQSTSAMVAARQQLGVETVHARTRLQAGADAMANQILANILQTSVSRLGKASA